jgi:hypothetical protein
MMMGIVLLYEASIMLLFDDKHDLEKEKKRIYAV